MNRNSKRGFTIFELVVYIGFVVLLSTAFVSLATVGQDEEVATEEKQLLRETSVDVFEQLQEDVGIASAITTPLLGASGGTLILTISGESVTYTLSGGQITRQVGAGSAAPVTPVGITISNLSFGNYGTTSPGAMEVSFEAGDTSFISTLSLLN